MRCLTLPALVIAVLALGACTDTPDARDAETAQAQAAARAAADLAPPPPEASAAGAPSDAGKACDSAQAQWMVGKPAAVADLKQVQADSGARNVRLLRPGQAVTMEFDATRLNLDLDAKGIVTNARCG